MTGSEQDDGWRSDAPGQVQRIRAQTDLSTASRSRAGRRFPRCALTAEEKHGSIWEAADWLTTVRFALNSKSRAAGSRLRNQTADLLEFAWDAAPTLETNLEEGRLMTLGKLDACQNDGPWRCRAVPKKREPRFSGVGWWVVCPSGRAFRQLG